MPSKCGGGRRQLRLEQVFSCKRYQQGVRLVRLLEQTEAQLQQRVMVWMTRWRDVGYLEQHIGLVWIGQVSLESCAQYVAQPIDLQPLRTT
ncbi:hypothetical protein QFZ45_003403 [Pseudomonas synxantha]|nr:hypothetical protein [Pseudomonas synxantha]